MSTSKTSPPAPNEEATVIGRSTTPSPANLRLRRRLSALLTLGVLVMGLTTQASPASASGPSRGVATSAQAYPQTWNTQPQCGWYRQSAYLNDYRITKAWLPWVSGQWSTYQRVWVTVQFVYRETGQVYRSGTFYTYARAGVWSKSWTSAANGLTGQTSVQDAAGESGYTNVARDVEVLMTLTWFTGTTRTDYNTVWATNPTSTQNQYVCDGGPWMY